MNVTLVCSSCGANFIWTHKDQVDAAKAIPLDDLLDAPGDEQPHFISPPKLCGACRLKKGEGPDVPKL